MTTAQESLTLLAPAKINLFLEVGAKRPDGYHSIRSVVAPVSLCDEIILERTDGDIEARILDSSELPACNGDHMPESDANLATRAARLLKEATRCCWGARIGIRKRIPLGGGLGGGSADAAVTFLGLNRLWGTGLSEEALRELAARLGCDIPALILGRLVLIEGKGERITPLRFATGLGTREWWLVLVNPGFCVPTRDVYARYQSVLTFAPETLMRMTLALERGDVELAAGGLFNALQTTVFAKYPLLEILAADLSAAGALGVLLSGSGASVFALTRDRQHAEAVAGRVTAVHGPWLWCRVVRMLPDGVTGSTQPFGG